MMLAMAPWLMVKPNNPPNIALVVLTVFATSTLVFGGNRLITASR